MASPTYERKKLQESLGMSIEQMEKRWKRKIYVQGEYPESGPYISFFADAGSSSFPTTTIDIPVEVITGEGLMLRGSEIDSRFPERLEIGIMALEPGGGRVYLAGRAGENIYTCDFYHNGHPFPEMVTVIDYLVSRDAMAKVAKSSVLASLEGLLRNYVGGVKLTVAKLSDEEMEAIKKVAMEYTDIAYQKILQNLKDKVRAEYKRGLEEGISLYRRVGKTPGWEITPEGFLHYTEEIRPNKIKYGGRIYEYEPEEDDPEFFARDIYFDPATYKAWAMNAHHPNIAQSTGQICLGDLEDQVREDITKILELPRVLKLMNLDSDYGNDASNDAREIVHDIIDNLEEEGGEVWEAI